jgi:pimeloyl-ACP methyl ester carboxylesterase
MWYEILSTAQGRCLMSVGSGLSKYANQAETVETIANDVLALLSHFSISPSKTILVGHSMGGMIACELASQHEFAGLALIGPIRPSHTLANAFTLRIEKVKECKLQSLAKEATG